MEVQKKEREVRVVVMDVREDAVAVALSCRVTNRSIVTRR